MHFVVLNKFIMCWLLSMALPLQSTHSVTNYYTDGVIHQTQNDASTASDFPSPNIYVFICAIAKSEDLYINEWITYHLGIGVNHLFIFDNSQENTLKDLPQRYPTKVTVHHFPEIFLTSEYKSKQTAAYDACTYSYRQPNTYSLVIDVDEFVVLYKHDTIQELLIDHLLPYEPRGVSALSLHWYMFGSNGHTEYSPEPVLQRFTKRGAVVSPVVKTMSKSMDVAFALEANNHPHFAHLFQKQAQVDTNGFPFIGARNVNGSSADSVATIHHYYTKSLGEFRLKMNRGHVHIIHTNYTMDYFHEQDQNEVEDSRA